MRSISILLLHLSQPSHAVFLPPLGATHGCFFDREKKRKPRKGLTQAEEYILRAAARDPRRAHHGRTNRGEAERKQWVGTAGTAMAARTGGV
ncbi:hypothetical protein BCV69DRAFT_283432 [Microstroma glucosiphilum]|uniref:Secreted protein n=1 Tax=Pseudomicrostroma glucosiphilum TaxID=1684307 RepID=A0A316U612_9BASI|nr:hypothetical protein BCV69DRAFT_283432 [Pseudomicrostroma glucosiphilum]PWN19901.1 hypothetical protein BCV69DRAFT_283432 [Pseudomicrostroma glucosiphilum]